MEYFDKTENERDLAIFHTVANTGCEIVKDCILPDTYGDVKKLLVTTARLTPNADRLDDDGISYSGTVAVSVVFLTEDGEVASITADCEYESRASLDAKGGLLHTTSLPLLENLQSRLVNPRKIGIRGRIKPNFSVMEDADASVSYPDSVTDEELLTFEEKTERLSYMTLESYSAVGIESGDDLSLDAGSLPISSILASELSFSSVSAQAREGAVAINGNADITLWYLGEREGEKALCSFRHSLPISTLVNCEGVKEKDVVLAALYTESASFSPGGGEDGDGRLCECDFTYTARVLVIREAIGYCTKDLYSTRFETVLSYGTVCMVKDVKKACATTRAKMTLGMKAGLVPISSHANLKQYHIEPDADGNVCLCGSASGYVMLEGQEGGMLTGETVDLPFTVTLALPYDGNRTYIAIPTLGFSEVRAVGEELTLSLAISCTVLSLAASEEQAIVAASPSAETESEQACSFTVYYPAEGESTWDIAKKYRVREDTLILAEREELGGGKSRRAVMIPAKKIAAYHEIITK